MLLVGTTALADTELAFATAAPGVDQEGEGRAAPHAATLHELLVLREDAALAVFLCQPLLHLAANQKEQETVRWRKTVGCGGQPGMPGLSPARALVGSSCRAVVLNLPKAAAL